MENKLKSKSISWRMLSVFFLYCGIFMMLMIMNVVCIVAVDSSPTALQSPPELPVMITVKTVDSNGVLLSKATLSVQYYTEDHVVVTTVIHDRETPGKYLFQTDAIDTGEGVVFSYADHTIELLPKRGEMIDVTLKVPVGADTSKSGFFKKLYRGIKNIFSTTRADDAPYFSSADSENKNTVILPPALKSASVLPPNAPPVVYSSKTSSSEDSTESAVIGYIIIGFIIVVIFIIIGYVLRKKYTSVQVQSIVSISKLHAIKAEAFMNKDIGFLTLTDTALDAIDFFMKYSTTIIPIVSSESSQKIVGIVTKRDILKASEHTDTHTLDLQTIPLSVLISKKYTTCAHNESLSAVYTKMSKTSADAVVVLRRGLYVGVIDYIDIIKLFLHADFSIENPPLLREALDTTMPFEDYTCNVEQLLRRFIAHELDYCIIQKNEIPLGIITTKDLLHTMKDVDIHKYTAQHVMSSNLSTLTPDAEIYEAFQLMVERNYNQIPIAENKLSGVVTTKSAVQTYYSMLSTIEK